MRNYSFYKLFAATVAISAITTGCSCPFSCSPRDAVERGTKLLQSGKYQESIAAFDVAIKASPNNPKFAVAYNNRALAQAKLHNYQDALKDYSMAIYLDPKYGGAYCNRGNLYDDHNKFQMAKSDYDIAIALNPKDSAAYNNRALVYARIGQDQNALADFSKSISLVPNDPGTYINRAHLYDHMLERILADKDRQTAKKLSSTKPGQ